MSGRFGLGVLLCPCKKIKSTSVAKPKAERGYAFVVRKMIAEKNMDEKICSR